MRLVVAFIVIAIVLFALMSMLQRRKKADGLTAGESTIRDLVRDVYAGKVMSEQVERVDSDAILTVQLRDEKNDKLIANLSSLARKHEEGASLPALRTSLKFD